MMNHFRRSQFAIACKWSSVQRSSYGNAPLKSVSDVGFAGFSSLDRERDWMSGFSKRIIHQLGGLFIQQREHCSKSHLIYQVPFQLAIGSRRNTKTPSFVRSFASKTAESTGGKKSEAQKAISTAEDPFDAPTYNIPEKPVTFTEGASYSFIILAGLGIAGAAAYGVFKELIFEPKEYKIFSKALDRIQNESQVRVRIGSPITGYGSESRNRAARQRIPNKQWTDEDGVEHVMVNFFIRGPHGAGKVYAEMFRDKVDKQWKFMYLIVEVGSPSPVQLMLESFVPA